MMHVLWLSMLACGPVPVSEPDADQVTPPLSIATIRQEGVDAGIWTVGPAAVISGRAADDLRSYVQDPQTGDGLEVRLAGYVPDWPPPVGELLTLRVYLSGAVAYLAEPRDVVLLGEAVEPVVLDAPADPRAFQLVRYAGVEVTSEPDPTGRAALSVGLALDGRFGVALPGAGNVGDLVAIVTEDQALAPRFDDDWQGSRADGVVLDSSIADVLAGRVTPGTTVRVMATMATPWSTDGTRTLLQDLDGAGLWLEREGFALPDPNRGDSGQWTAQVQWRAGVWHLRSWWPILKAGRSPTLRGTRIDHGLVADVEVSGLGPVDAFGDRSTAEGWLLDDRFIALDALADRVTVRAAVDAEGGVVRLAAIRELEPDDTDQNVQDSPF